MKLSFFKFILFFSFIGLLQSCQMNKGKSNIETKTFENIEMIEYCLPIPINYQQNHEFSKNAPRAQHQFKSDTNNPTITFKGSSLSMDFEQLQTKIEKQLQELNTKHEIHKDKSTISYTFNRDNKVLFEKKWQIKDNSVTVTLEQNASNDKKYFNQLIQLFESANPSCQ